MKKGLTIALTALLWSHTALADMIGGGHSSDETAGLAGEECVQAECPATESADAGWWESLLEAWEELSDA